MMREYEYISIKEILSRIMRHPLLRDLDIEAAVQYTVDFIRLFGLPAMFKQKEEKIKIHEYRGVLPCDLISTIQVKDAKTGICLRSITDSFDDRKKDGNLSFKIQNRIIYTSIKKGEVIISYKAIAVDEHGFPLLIDDPTFLRALEAFIKKEAFTILFDLGKIAAAVLQNIQQEYAWRAGQLHSTMMIPSLSEMESLKNMWCQLLVRDKEFTNGFKDLGAREHYKTH